MRRLELVFPAPNRPLSINEANRMHWAAKKRRLDPWRDATHVAWIMAKSEHHLVKNRPCTVEIHLPFTDDRRRDPHNYSSTVQKSIIDALVRKTTKIGSQTVELWEGCWEDDNPQWVKTLEPVLYKGGECRVVITADE